MWLGGCPFGGWLVGGCVVVGSIGRGIDEGIASLRLLLLFVVFVFINNFLGLLEGHVGGGMVGGLGVGLTGLAVVVEENEGRGDDGDGQIVHVFESGVQRELVKVSLEVVGVDTSKDDGKVEGLNGDDVGIGGRGKC